MNPRAQGCLGGFDNQNVTASSDELGAEVRLSRAWDLPVATLDAGFTFGGSMLTQSFEGNREAPDRTSFGLHIDAGVGASVNLYRNLYVFTELDLQNYFYKFQETATSDRSWASTVAFRTMLGLGFQL